MNEISRQDLHEFKEEIKEHIDEKFVHHEEREQLMLSPIRKQIEEHDIILRGKDKQGGLIKVVQQFKAIAGIGGFAGVSNWVKDLLSKL